jgi:hypothetical protein
MSGRRARYELKVSYEITHADDIDILDGGEYAHELYGSPLDALGDLGHFISQNGGPDAWDELNPHEIASCWLPDGPHTEIATMPASIASPPLMTRDGRGRSTVSRRA